MVNPSLDINSEAYINGGSDDNVRRIIIETDSLTGEFAVKLPPLEYVVESLTIIGNNKALETKLISKIDASNPLVVNVDSIEIEEGKYKKFDYCAAMKLKYQNTPVFTVTDKSNGYGAFGEAFLKYQDVTMTKAVDVPVYTFEKNNLTYNIKVGTKAYPIYVQDNKYRFELKADRKSVV